MRRRWRYLTVLALPWCLTIEPSPAAGQTRPWSDRLLPRIRGAAGMVPGALPQRVRVLRFGAQKLPQSYLLAGGTEQPIPAVYTVFQVGFGDGWIMVDAGMDAEVAGDTTALFRAQDRQVQEALRRARSIVVTHEHHDHVAGVIRSAAVDTIAPRTVLTRAQIRTLRERPNVPLIKLDSVTAARYTVVDFDLLYPLAPGVVLVRAPGHTPGSQMVYVRLGSGRELLLIGDIAWHMAGVEQRRQKPEATSRDMGEDRTALAAQLEWLHGLTARAGIQIVNSHDARWLEHLIARGVLDDGLDLGHQ